MESNRKVYMDIIRVIAVFYVFCCTFVEKESFKELFIKSILRYAIVSGWYTFFWRI